MITRIVGIQTAEQSRLSVQVELAVSREETAGKTTVTFAETLVTWKPAAPNLCGIKDPMGIPISARISDRI